MGFHDASQGFREAFRNLKKKFKKEKNLKNYLYLKINYTFNN